MSDEKQLRELFHQTRDGVAKALRLEQEGNEFYVPAEPGPLGPFTNIVEAAQEFMAFIDRTDADLRSQLSECQRERDVEHNTLSAIDALVGRKPIEARGTYAAVSKLKERAESLAQQLQQMKERMSTALEIVQGGTTILDGGVNLDGASGKQLRALLREGE